MVLFDIIYKQVMIEIIISNLNSLESKKIINYYLDNIN